jgi:hypothetical protein
MPSWLIPIVWMLGLVALYLVLVHAGGAAKALESLAKVTVNETVALQGGYTNTPTPADRLY